MICYFMQKSPVEMEKKKKKKEKKREISSAENFTQVFQAYSDQSDAEENEPRMGSAMRKRTFEHAQDMQIHIILHVREVTSGPLLSIETFCSIRWFWQRTAKALIRMHGCVEALNNVSCFLYFIYLFFFISSAPHVYLAKIFSRRHIGFFFPIFPENRILNFIQIGDNLYEMSNPVFLKKRKKKKKKEKKKKHHQFVADRISKRVVKVKQMFPGIMLYGAIVSLLLKQFFRHTPLFPTSLWALFCTALLSWAANMYLAKRLRIYICSNR